MQKMTLDLNLYGMEELSQQELLLIDGGSWLAGWIVGAILAIITFMVLAQ